MSKKNRLTIYLLKDNFDSSGLVNKDLKNPILLQEGTFYHEETPNHLPTWVENFFGESLTTENADLRVRSVKGLLLTTITVKKKVVHFALTFGHGRFLLNEAAIERRFGLKVTVNAVDASQIRAIEKTNIGPNTKISREQMNKSVETRQFGIDIEQDLLRSVRGKSKQDYGLGTNIEGSDALSITVETGLDKLNDVLLACYKRYISDDYKKDFDWIDRIYEVKEPDLITFLDSQIVEQYNLQDFSKLWLAVPELLDWDTVSGFKYLPYDRQIHDDIDINIYYEKKGTISSIHDLSEDVQLISSENGTPFRRWPIYNCLYAEVDHNQKKYVLNNGKWFEVDKSFSRSVKKTYDHIPISNVRLPVYEHSSEGEYNKATCQQNPAMLLMDKNTIPYGGGKNKIEYADIYSKDKQIIHVKHYGASSVLSHLFFQGLNSAEYLSDSAFRKSLNIKLKTEWKVPVGTSFNPAHFEVVFAIIQKGTQARPQIPFFSMVSIRNVYKRLTTRGFKVSILRIDVKDAEGS
jgi:uncharacterized protein (TIGR04141 family)